MLSFGSDFWPLFWTIIGPGALLTGAPSALIARSSGRSRRTRVVQSAADAVAPPRGSHRRCDQRDRAAR